MVNISLSSIDAEAGWVLLKVFCARSTVFIIDDFHRLSSDLQAHLAGKLFTFHLG